MTSDKYKFTNSLINETSPYLLQHAHNPVNWYPWGDTAFEKAKNEDKLVLISIGYAACHWCHVMEHESFESETVAKIMNDKFVCIKVDREERPDVDQVYMSAVQLLTGQGGWPLNCFALPDGRPVYGGTYFKPDQWTQILEGLALTYKEDKERVFNAAKELEQGIKNTELIAYKKPELKFTPKQIDKIVEPWKRYFDHEWGGNNRAPKFAIPISLEFLLNYGSHSKDSGVLEHLNLTLTKIGDGGIYDHVGGGFARYAVDEKWMIPHFEKMLYDNGQLVSLYSKAYKHTKNNEYKRKAEQTLAFISREMTTKEGAFYASLDADSEGVEGKFYVWDKTELKKLLDEDAEWYCDYYNVTESGNWEHSNILWVSQREEVLDKYDFCVTEVNEKLDKCNAILFKKRTKRIYPGLDDKILTAWNALMAIGYLDAYEAFGKERYLQSALKNAEFLKTQMLQADGSLNRNFKHGKSNITGFLDDYALTIQLFAKVYQNTFDENWLMHAKDLTTYVIDHFLDANSGMFYYTADNGEKLIARKMELSDNVIPGSNSIMANNLFDLGTILADESWKKMAKQMLSNVSADIEKSAAYYANWGILMNKIAYPNYEIVITGTEALELKKEFVRMYYPNAIVAGAIKESKNKLALFKNRFKENESLIFVCQEKQCQLGLTNILDVQKLLK